jgi:hypothetical protein
VKLVLAVSGAGNTRMLLELFYSTCGYFFTVKRSAKDFGSADFSECRNYYDYHPENLSSYDITFVSLFATT